MLFDNTKIAFESKNNSQLKEAYYLFKVIGNPFLTKLNIYIFKIPFLINLPFVKTLIKKTVYKHFVGGETPEDCIKVIKSLYKYKVSSILDYSVEALKDESSFDKSKREILNLISLAKENIEIPFVVFKPTAFGDIDLFEKVGKNIELTNNEKNEWDNIKSRFNEVCRKGFEKNVKLLLDAEESWMQDAADDLIDEMMQKYNKKECIIYNTLQLYRVNRLDYLKKIHSKAIKENYYIGFKIVRGAYMEKERARALEQNYPSPIQPNKESTDKDFNQALEYIINNIDRISLFSGTHNEESCLLLTQLMEQKKIPKDQENIWVGQLYGMSDNISFNLAKLGYNVSKYLPYGPIKKVMPYLIRRANENTSIAGQSSRELTLIKTEINRRKNN